MKLKSGSLTLSWMAAGVLAASSPLQAQWTWTGAGENNLMTNEENWAEVGAPPNRDQNTDLILGPGVLRTTLDTSDYAQSFYYQTLTFQENAPAFTIGGTQSLEWRLVPVTITQNSANAQNIDAHQLSIASTVTFAGSGTGTLFFNTMHQASRNVTLTASSTTFLTVIEGAITQGGTRSVNKAGPGTIELQGSNAFNGSTITGGALLLTNSTGSATGGGPVAVNNNGTLAGTGRAGGTTTVNSGGTLAPGIHGAATAAGNEIGMLTLGGLVLNDGAILRFDERDGDTDLFRVENNLTFADGATINLRVAQLGTQDATPQTFTLIDVVGGTTTGFNPNNWNFDLTGSAWTAASVSQQGNDIILNVIPEPSSVILTLAGLIGILGMFRRRARS